MAARKKVQVVEITWIDSASRHGWTDRNDVDDIALIHSVGFLVRETKDVIVISTSFHEEDFADPLSVPKVAIRSRRNLKWQPPKSRSLKSP